MRLRRDDEAIAVFEKVLGLAPSSSDTLLDLGVLYRARGELDRAIDAFERAIAADPGFAQAWGGLAVTYAVLPAYSNRLTRGETQTSSLDAAQRALVLDPTQPEPYLAMGQVAGASGRRQTASALLSRAIELRPSSRY